MKNKRISLLCFVALGLASCQDSAEDFDKQYYDVEGVISQLIAVNKQQRPDYEKEVWINGDKETVNASADLDWEKELEVFLLADLNKRDYLNKYSKDSSANKVIYTLKPEVEAPVSSLEIDFQDNAVSGLTAILKTDNFLYESERVLTFTVSDDQLRSYEVLGWQELFMGGKKTYRLRSTRNP